MKPLDIDFDPYAHDPGHWGPALVNFAELLVGCLDAAGARSVVEIGAYAGDLTGFLVKWGARSGARIGAIDPDPEPDLVKLADANPALDLVRETSLDALGRIELPDAVIIDGDHNYYTVSEELRLIGERAQGSALPLLLFHDVCWPHARRDDYYAPDQVPEEHRQPIVEGGGVFPGEPGIRPGGLPFRFAAAREGGPRNGVLTAIEDFVASSDGLRLVIVPAFFGLGVVFHRDAPYAERIAAILDPFDRHPMLERLEANRVLHLASVHYQMVEVGRLQERLGRQEALLHKLLESKTFALGVALSRLRQRGEPAYSKDEVRRALG